MLKLQAYSSPSMKMQHKTGVNRDGVPLQRAGVNAIVAWC
jgi:hypothetical protein